MESKESRGAAAGLEGTLELEVEGRLVPLFFQLLGRGFIVMIERPVPLRRFLTDALRMEEDYVDRRIQTLMLDGKPVDDVDNARVCPGMTLALSAAMPGLLGAMLRKGGYYRKMRDSISHRETGEGGREDAGGAVLVKLFNLVAKEKGPPLLKRGVRVPSPGLTEFMTAQPQMFWDGCTGAWWNGMVTGRQHLLALIRKEGGEIHLKVRTA